MLNKITTLTPILLFLGLSSCTHQNIQQAKYYQNKDGIPSDNFVTKAKNGIVSAAHPLASNAGLDMLEAGGNAIDAMAAASFVISVVRPQSTGIGGGGFMLFYNAPKKKTDVYDFRERAPIKASKDMYLNKKGEPKLFKYKNNTLGRASVDGHLSVGMPGLVAGIVKAHKQHGLLPLAKVLAPAIKIAEKGFKVYPSLEYAVKVRKKVLTSFEGSKALFYPHGKPIKTGDILIQKDLAKTLRLIAKKGHDGFYKGETRDLILKEIRAGKGILTKKDFSSYKVKQRKPIIGNYRGHKVVSMPPPSSGGVHIVEILNMLSGDDIKALGHNTPKGIHLLAEAMRRAYADRAKYMGDDDFVKVPTKGLTSKKYALKLRESIDPNKATPSRSLANVSPTPYESSSTTHMSIVDKWGNAVSSTQTINYTFGSGVVARGTGIVLNDEMDDFSIKPGVANSYGLVGSRANAIAAKKTMLSSMSPTLVFDKNNKLELIVGSPGGSRIINATLQVIINTIDHKMPLKEAVHAFRIHHQWLPDEIRIEPNGLPKETISALNKMGHKVTEKIIPIGDVQAISKMKNGWIGVSDTRSDGKPAGY